MSPPAPGPSPGCPAAPLCADCGERVAVTLGHRSTWKRAEVVVPLCGGCRCHLTLARTELAELGAASFSVVRGEDLTWRERQGPPWGFDFRATSAVSSDQVHFSRVLIYVSWPRNRGILLPRQFCEGVQGLPVFGSGASSERPFSSSLG